jgi:hypothetical protein
VPPFFVIRETEAARITETAKPPRAAEFAKKKTSLVLCALFRSSALTSVAHI